MASTATGASRRRQGSSGRRPASCAGRSSRRDRWGRRARRRSTPRSGRGTVPRSGRSPKSVASRPARTGRASAVPEPAGTQAPTLDGEPHPRLPSLAESVAVIGLLIVLIVMTVALFGTDATSGPLQVSLLLAALGAGFLSWRLGHTTAAIRDAAVGGVSSAMSAVYILLAVGALIGTWNLSGTIPTIVYYGIGLLQPSIFYLSAVLICGLVGLSIGSSWTTAATIGVGLVALAPAMGASPEITAGAVISASYFGDNMTPISETTVLVPSMVGGVTTQEHIGAMIWTSGPAIAIAAGLYGLLGLFGVGEGVAFDRT